ncbi:MAG: YbaB/EbfC family nucleoid-associated protein [Actinoallomurus sp.]
MTDFGGYLSKREIEETLHGAEKHMGRVKQLQEVLGSVVGRAQSQDGRVKIECANEKGVTKVQLDPRAMRMASEELAETITALSQEAMADLRKQTQAAIRETFGGGEEAFNLEAARARRQEVGETFQRALGDAQSEMNRLMKRLEESGMAPGQNGHPTRSQG